MKTMRRAFRHSLCIVHSALCIAFAATAAFAEDYVLSGATWHWKGGGANALASTSANWAEGTAPTELAAIVFDEQGEGKPCTWDLDIPLQSWFQSNYTSTVTFNTVYAENGFFKLRIRGDCALYSGKWTHLGNAATYRQYRLYASVGGNMTIGPNATIDATAKGYTQQYIASSGTFQNLGNYHGGTYGGYGTWNSGLGAPHASGVEPYGSITAPEDPGSAGNNKGGGAVRLDVAGALALDGAIVANGVLKDYYSGSGGSVYLRAGTISGSGSVKANGQLNSGKNYRNGSGGRIAIVLTAPGAGFSAFDPVSQCEAISRNVTGTTGAELGGPGTIYAETPADTPGRGWLILKDSGASHTFKYANAYPFTPGIALADYSRVTVTNNAKIYLTPGNTLDLRNTVFEASDTSGVYLDGGALKPAAGGDIHYYVVSAGRLNDIDASSLTFRSGATLAVITSDDAFAGDVTIGSGVTATVATSLTVDGDLALDGTIRRPDGPFDADPKALDLHVTGDMAIGASGLVTMSGSGFSKGYCPPDQSIPGSSGASHGGRGWRNNTIANGVQTTLLPYGSITEPATAGAGGASYGSGGGILRLVVDGALANNGGILAESVSGNYYAAAGGSVNVRAGSLTGSGRISADCARMTQASGPSGGGRVAVRLTSSGADFSGYTGEFSARGSRVNDNAGQWVGGAGTVWLRTASQGDDGGALVVDNMKAGLSKWADTTVGGEHVEGTAFGDVLVGRSARLNLADGATLHVSGVLSNGCEFVAGNGSSVDFTGAGESRVFGDFSFQNLACASPGKVITVNDGATIAVAGVASFAGTAANPVTIRGATAGEPWTLDPAGPVTMDGVALRDCQSTADIIVLNGTDLGGNSANITFMNVAPGELITWTGTAGTSWAAAGSWDRGRPPVSTDRVLIPSGPSAMPVLAAPAGVAELTVQSGATLSLGGCNLTVAGNAVLAGSLVASGSEVLDVGGDLTVSSGFSAAQSTVRLSNATTATLTSAGATLYALEIATPAVTLSGSLSCVSFTAGDGASAFNLAFADNMSLSVNFFTAHGDAATTNGVLRCATDGGSWNLSVNQADVSGVAVKGSDASSGVAIAPSDCRDDGGNVNWLFVDDRTHWDGTSWSRGEPTASIDAVVDPGASLSVSSPLATRGLTVASGASVRVTAALEAAGSVTLEGGSTVTWDVPGTIGGNLVMLSGSTLTHTANGTTEAYKINLSVAGSGYIADGAKVTATGRGYNGVSTSPGGSANKGGSYGGRGYTNGNNGQGRGDSKPCYGSALCPTNCGSGASYSQTSPYGGGAVKMSFGGPLVLDGGIDANGPTSPSFYTGSGGSVWLTAASLSGSGTISACGGNSSSSSYLGGGGRVAIYLTEATSADTFLGTIAIHGGLLSTGKTDGSPGTYYLQTAADADGAGVLSSFGLVGGTSLRVNDNATEIEPAVLAREGEMKKVRVEGSAYSYLYLVKDTRVKDIHLLDSTAKLYLKGHTLRVGTTKHAVSPNDATQIVSDGGQIIWQQPASIIMLQ